MSRYTPIPHPALDCALTSLADLRWNREVLDADFPVPDRAAALRAHFDRAEMIRVLDEMPLSTEDKAEGTVAGHLAYLVEGGPFLAQQSAAWRDIHKGIRHFQFITAGYCLDVLAYETSHFTVVEE